MTTNMNFIAVKIKEIKMAQEKNVTRNLILLLIGMIVIYLLQKNGNFFPILFVVLSIFLIWKNKSGFSKKDFIIGIALAALSLNPIYVICIIFGYMGAKQLYDKSNVKISLLPKTKQEIIVYGVLPAIFLTLLNTVWMIQTNPIDFSFRVNAIVGGLIASIPEEVLFRYLVFAVCVYMGKGNKKARIRYASIHRYDLETNRKNGTMRKLCTGCREPDTYSDIGNYFRADIDKRLDKCRDFLFVIYISINIVYCILHCGSSDYFDDYYFRFLQFTKNSVG